MRHKTIKFLLIISSFLVIFISSSLSAFAALDPLPAYHTPYNYQEKYTTDLFSGSASYAYPIKVPKGTNDLTPDISLSYSSGNARGFVQRFGMGWELSQDYVERDVNYTPNDTSDDKFKLHFKGSVYDLVYVSVDGRYHTKIESNLNVQKLTGGANDYGNYWQVITPDGTKYRFGYASQSELGCSGRSYGVNWSLDLVTDTHGNNLYYIYTESNGDSYLSQIKYNNDQTREIDFSYTSSSYQHPVYQQGCIITDASQLNSIQVKIGTTLVHEYDLGYTTGTNNQPLLHSITEKGSNGTSTLPATTFDYKPEIQSWNTQPTTWINNAEIDVNLQKIDVIMADVNGDGLLDIVKSEGNGNNTWKVWRNTGNGWSITYETWINNAPIDAKLDRTDTRFMDVNGDGLPDIIKTNGATSWTVFRNTGNSWNTNAENWANLSSYGSNLDLTSTSIHLIDVNGDGLPDIVNSWWNGAEEWRVFMNTGNGWRGTPEIWSHGGVDKGLDDTTIHVIDVNGDGLPDIVKVTANGTNDTWQVWKNTGSGWSTSPETWINNAGVDANFSMTNVVVQDVNGDGLPDIIKSDDLGSADRWKVLLNQGNSWSTTWVNWIDPSSSVDLSLQGNTQMADVTGEGLPDIIRTTSSGGNFDTWQVWKNSGSAPDLLSTVHTSQGGTNSYNYSSSATPVSELTTNASYTGEYFNNQTLSGSPTLTRTDPAINFDWGSGSPDSSLPSDHFSVRWTQTTSFTGGTYIFTASSDDGIRLYVDGELILDQWTDSGYLYYTVSKALSTGNHTVKLEYYEDYGGARVKLSYQKIGLPFSVWQVNQMTVDNGIANTQNTHDVTNYSYTNGSYKFENHEFRGFGEANTIEPNTAKKKYIFNQDNAAKGKLASVQTMDSSGNPYDLTEDSWSNILNNGVYTANLNSEKKSTYDGSVSNPKVSETDYQYDSYGNVTKKSELGDTSISGDERFTYSTYTYNPSIWLVNKVSDTYINNSDDSTKVSETTDYYDNNATLTNAPTKGDVTKEIKWLNGGTSPITQYTYDSYGNQTQVADANGHTTQTTYGTNDITNTYPDSVTNAKNQTTTSTYDLGTGNLLSKTDPNGFITSYTYDVFGRVNKEIDPYDTTSLPTISYQYFDGAAPQGTLVSKLKVSGSSPTFDSYTFIDGLGRKIQTRTPAQDTTKQIVSDTFYDTTGQVSKQTVPHLDTLVNSYANPVAGSKSTDTTHDPIGRVISIINPQGTSKTTAYNHWVETNTDENSHQIKNYRDAFANIIQVDELNGSQTQTTKYAYDVLNNLTKITDANNNNFIFSYDTLGRKTSQTDPDIGTWNYTYDGIGNLLTKKDNRNVTTTRTYDEVNRVTKVDYPNDMDVLYTYDGNSKIGTLTSVTDAAGTIAYSYDNRLRKTQEQRVMDNTAWTTQFAYDDLNNITSRTNPDGEVITYAFNPQNEVASVSGVLNNITYDALGHITQKSFANGLTTNYSYNTDDFRLNRIQTGTVQDQGYSYDAVGNVTSITDNILTKTQNFVYDSLNRLKNAQETNGYNYAYSYNPIGNLTAFINASNEIDYTYGQNAGVHAITSSTESSPTPTPTPTPPTPLTATLTEDWSSGSINTSKWNNWSGSQINVVNNQLKIDTTPWAGYYEVNSWVNGMTHDLTGSSVSDQLVDPGNQSLASFEVYPVTIYNANATNNQLLFFVSNNTLYAWKKVSGTDTIVSTGAYNAANNKYFKIRENSGTVYWETSTNGSSWTTFASTPTPFDITHVYMSISAGTWGSETTTTSPVFDNFNIFPVTPTPTATNTPTPTPTLTPTTSPSSSVTEDWSSGSINTLKWNNWSGNQINVVNNQLKIDSVSWPSYFEVNNWVNGMYYNLTGSSVSNQLISAGNQSLASWEVYPIAIYNVDNANNNLRFFVSNNTVYAWKQVSGVNTIIATSSYNPTNQKYFRIRENSGTVYFETSTTGSSWTSFASTTTPFDITKVYVSISAGTWTSESTTTSAIFDNFNILP
ncbi:MAG TPA: FG-GAP-like repeat-containing protein [Candidatus Saccharimonadales bacterium]|nr:FG-GAP-like repeat-containing protein [Candidatus Saccharimonadales bacterium]